MTTMYLCICVCLCLQYCFSSLAIAFTMHYFMHSEGFILQINRFRSFMMDRAGKDSKPAHWSALVNVKKGINCVFLTFTFINFMALPNNKGHSYYTEIIDKQLTFFIVYYFFNGSTENEIKQGIFCELIFIYLFFLNCVL